MRQYCLKKVDFPICSSYSNFDSFLNQPGTLYQRSFCKLSLYILCTGRRLNDEQQAQLMADMTKLYGGKNGYHYLIASIP